MNALDLNIDEAGGFGWYQVSLLLGCMLPVALVGANMGASVFIAMMPKARCKSPISEELVMQDCPETFQSLLVPMGDNGPSLCSRYNYSDRNISLMYRIAANENNSTFCNISLGAQLPDTVPCDAWSYDRSLMRSTIVTDFDLMCEDSWAGYFSQSALMLGVALGSMLAGTLSDRLGRRHAFLFVCVGALTFGTALAFTQSYLMFCIIRVLFGSFAYSSFPVLFVLNSEMTTPRYRPLSCQMVEMGFALGYLYLSFVSYLLREWRKVQILLTAPFALCILIWWFMPESPRWLFQEGRREEAWRIILQMARVNRRQMNGGRMSERELPNQLDNQEKIENTMSIKCDEKESHNVFRSFKHGGIRCACLKLFYVWFCVSCVYYGLTLNAGELGSNPFMNMCLNCLIEVVGNAAIIPLVSRTGRRPPLCTSGILAGVMCVLVAFLPTGKQPVAMLGKLSIGIGFAIVYIYTNEFFPTPIRTSAVTMCNAMARLGGVVSPLIAMSRLSLVELPYILFGFLSITAGGVLLTLPETKGASLPQTLEEGEKFINRKQQQRELKKEIQLDVTAA